MREQGRGDNNDNDNSSVLNCLLLFVGLIGVLYATTLQPIAWYPIDN